MGVLEIADIIGVIAFALSGFYVAAKDRLDLLGVFISSFLTALGGGIMRDVAADRIPYTFTHLLPGMLVLGVLVFAILFKLHKHDQVEQKFLFVISDTIGLVSFSITGSLIALEVGYNFFGVILLALTTAVGGGVIRDVLLNKVPLLLSTGLYGTVALIVGGCIFVLDCFELVSFASLLGVGFCGIALRLTAYYRSWHLPILK